MSEDESQASENVVDSMNRLEKKDWEAQVFCLDLFAFSTLIAIWIFLGATWLYIRRIDRLKSDQIRQATWRYFAVEGILEPCDYNEVFLKSRWIERLWHAARFEHLYISPFIAPMHTWASYPRELRLLNLLTLVMSMFASAGVMHKKDGFSLEILQANPWLVIITQLQRSLIIMLLNFPATFILPRISGITYTSKTVNQERQLSGRFGALFNDASKCYEKDFQKQTRQRKMRNIIVKVNLRKREFNALYGHPWVTRKRRCLSRLLHIVVMVWLVTCTWVNVAFTCKFDKDEALAWVTTTLLSMLFQIACFEFVCVYILIKYQELRMYLAAMRTVHRAERAIKLADPQRGKSLFAGCYNGKSKKDVMMHRIVAAQYVVDLLQCPRKTAKMATEVSNMERLNSESRARASREFKLLWRQNSKSAWPQHASVSTAVENQVASSVKAKRKNALERGGSVFNLIVGIAGNHTSKELLMDPEIQKEHDFNTLLLIDGLDENEQWYLGRSYLADLQALVSVGCPTDRDVINKWDHVFMFPLMPLARPQHSPAGRQGHDSSCLAIGRRRLCVHIQPTDPLELAHMHAAWIGAGQLASAPTTTEMGTNALSVKSPSPHVSRRRLADVSSEFSGSFRSTAATTIHKAGTQKSARAQTSWPAAPHKNHEHQYRLIPPCKSGKTTHSIKKPSASNGGTEVLMKVMRVGPGSDTTPTTDAHSALCKYAVVMHWTNNQEHNASTIDMARSRALTIAFPMTEHQPWSPCHRRRSDVVWLSVPECTCCQLDNKNSSSCSTVPNSRSTCDLCGASLLMEVWVMHQFKRTTTILGDNALGKSKVDTGGCKETIDAQCANTEPELLGWVKWNKEQLCKIQSGLSVMPLHQFTRPSEGPKQAALFVWMSFVVYPQGQWPLNPRQSDQFPYGLQTDTLHEDQSDALWRDVRLDWLSHELRIPVEQRLVLAAERIAHFAIPGVQHQRSGTQEMIGVTVLRKLDSESLPNFASFAHNEHGVKTMRGETYNQDGWVCFPVCDPTGILPSQVCIHLSAGKLMVCSPRRTQKIQRRQKSHKDFDEIKVAQTAHVRYSPLAPPARTLAGATTSSQSVSSVSTAQGGMGCIITAKANEDSGEILLMWTVGSKTQTQRSVDENQVVQWGIAKQHHANNTFQQLVFRIQGGQGGVFVFETLNALPLSNALKQIVDPSYRQNTSHLDITGNTKLKGLSLISNRNLHQPYLYPCSDDPSLHNSATNITTAKVLV